MEAAMLVGSEAMTSLVDNSSSLVAMNTHNDNSNHHQNHTNLSLNDEKSSMMNLEEIEMHADVMTSSLNEDDDVMQQMPLDEVVSQPQDDLQSTPKRRRSVLTLEQKLEVIKRIKHGEKITKLAAEYGVGKATVSDLKRQEDKITAFVSKMSVTGPKRKTMRRPNDERIEKALHLWISRERKRGTHISGPLLMEKAKAFHKQLYGEEDDKFKASTGWLHRFKIRNGIKHQKTMSSKKKTVETTDETDIQTQLGTLRRFIHENCIGPEQIYTASKRRLHWRALPFKPTTSDCQIGSSRECIQVVGCVNATGTHKLRLALIGRPDSTFLFENVNVAKMPFQFNSQDDGWMDAEVFAEWFHKEFVSSVRSYYRGAGLAARALLLVDDCVPLPYGGDDEDGPTLRSDDGAIRCIGIASATSFVTQPINGLIFEMIKRSYRKKLVSRVIAVLPGRKIPSRAIDFSKFVTLKDAGYMLSEAWSAVQAETIRRLWKDTLYCLGAVDEQAVVVDELLKKVDDHALTCSSSDSMCSLVEDSFKIAELLKDYDKNVSEDDVANWLSMDGEDTSNRMPLSDRDIIETVRFDVVGGSESEDEGCENVGKVKQRNERRGEQSSVCVPSDAEACACFSKCLMWLESQSDCEPANLQLLWKLQNAAAQKKRENRR